MFDALTWAEKQNLRTKLRSASHKILDEAVQLHDSGLAPYQLRDMYGVDSITYTSFLAEIAGLVLDTYPPVEVTA